MNFIYENCKIFKESPRHRANRCWNFQNFQSFDVEMAKNMPKIERKGSIKFFCNSRLCACAVFYSHKCVLSVYPSSIGAESVVVTASFFLSLPVELRLRLLLMLYVDLHLEFCHEINDFLTWSYAGWFYEFWWSFDLDLWEILKKF